MKLFKYVFITLLIMFCAATATAQEFVEGELSLNEYLGYVKKYHPIVRQANLKISRAQAELMAARGGFDPKIEVDYNEKQFKETEYYSLLNSSFKIPTWYGIEIKAAFDNSEGVYVNPQNKTPNAGLTSLGLTVPVGNGLFINDRMADVQKGKLQLSLSEAERKLAATEVLYDAAKAYFEWKKTYTEMRMYEDYLGYASERYAGVLQLIELGDSPRIDSVESGITVKTRRLNFENAKLKYTKARLNLANYLWIENVPVEPADTMYPEENLAATITETLQTNKLLFEPGNLEEHPKIQSLQTKLDILEVDRRLKANKLLPKLEVGYHYLSEPSYFDNYRFNDYKVSAYFSFPIFLRKERGNLQVAKFKIQDAQYELGQQQLQLQNKIRAQQTEIESLMQQKEMAGALVADYDVMLKSEVELFSYGESSIFLINSRENKLVEAMLKQIDLENKYFISNAELFKIMANPD
ncbi:TolC family protein [Flavobacterium rhizosphaerae]|uniref:TolC family protein n=1 Tax=Flavobacterium rhizosphaerae TaxID=3163298 RepID=A0ABW8YZL0_9FLAO